MPCASAGAVLRVDAHGAQHEVVERHAPLAIHAHLEEFPVRDLLQSGSHKAKQSFWATSFRHCAYNAFCVIQTERRNRNGFLPGTPNSGGSLCSCAVDFHRDHEWLLVLCIAVGDHVHVPLLHDPQKMRKRRSPFFFSPLKYADTVSGFPCTTRSASQLFKKVVSCS